MSNLNSQRPMMAVEITQRCREWLDQEYEYQQSLGQVLEGLSAQSPFSQHLDSDSQSQMSQLLIERERLMRDQNGLRADIGRFLGVADDKVRLTALETQLSHRESQDLREQRLRMISQVEANRKRLRIAEITLSRHNSCITDVLAHLLGQTASTTTYGADGCQSIETSDLALQAVS